jgi:uncharacterized membrane protein
MKMKMITMKKTFIGIFAVLLMANISSAAIELNVSPDNGIVVVQGGTLNYTATLTLTEALGFPPMDETFSIEEADKQPGWTYTFSPTDVSLSDPGDIRTTKLTITVPLTAPTGIYNHTVIATGTDEMGRTIKTWSDIETFEINTAIYPTPELSTIMLTSAGLLGLVFVSRKYKGT